MLEQKYQKPPSPQNTTNSGSESDTSSVMELNEKLLEAHKKVSQSPHSKNEDDGDDDGDEDDDDVDDDDDDGDDDNDDDGPGWTAEDEPGSCSHD